MSLEENKKKPRLWGPFIPVTLRKVLLGWGGSKYDATTELEGNDDEDPGEYLRAAICTKMVTPHDVVPAQISFRGSNPSGKTTLGRLVDEIRMRCPRRTRSSR